MRRIATAAFVVTLLAGTACSAGEVTGPETVTVTETVRITETPAPTTVPSGPVSNPPADTMVIEVFPDAPILGVDIGTEGEAAIAAVADLLGPPTDDSGWNEGCPLDGPEANERVVTWGGLRLLLNRPDDGTGTLYAWGYETSVDLDGGPGINQIVLPGDTRLGQPMLDIADASGFDTLYDETFDIVSLGSDFTVYGIGDDVRTPAEGVYVPFQPTCE